MGDRANIVVKSGEEQVCLYTHWDGLERTGYNALWLWFGLDRASWLTLPRVMMHEMPDDWQLKMAELLEEWDATWDSQSMPSPCVSAKRGGKFTRWPEWLLNYRRPQRDEIERLRSNAPHEGPGAASSRTVPLDAVVGRQRKDK